MSGDEAWLHVGAEVAEVSSPGGIGARRTVRTSTITKIGKRDVVLANGNRYNVTQVGRSGWDRTGSPCIRFRGGDTWDRSIRLLFPADAPEVAEARNAATVAAAIGRARGLCEVIDKGLRGVVDAATLDAAVVTAEDLASEMRKAAELQREIDR